MNNSVSGLLGISFRGRRLAIGEDAWKQMGLGRIVLLIIAGDASDNTKKRCMDKCTYYNVKSIIYGTKYELGRCLGKTAVSCLGIYDAKLAAKIKLLMKDGEENDKK